MIRTIAIAFLMLLACAKTAVEPADLDTKNDSCAWCRMAVSDRRFASQIVAPGVEPMFFDDIGCLVKYLKSPKEHPAGLTVFVADYETKEWIAAERAFYERCPDVETPMGSHLIAHTRSTAAGKGCSKVTAAQLFGETLKRDSK